MTILLVFYKVLTNTLAEISLGEGFGQFIGYGNVVELRIVESNSDVTADNREELEALRVKIAALLPDNHQGKPLPTLLYRQEELLIISRNSFFTRSPDNQSCMVWLRTSCSAMLLRSTLPLSLFYSEQLKLFSPRTRIKVTSSAFSMSLQVSMTISLSRTIFSVLLKRSTMT